MSDAKQSWLRERAVPVVGAVGLAIAALLFHNQILDWFRGGGESASSPASGAHDHGAPGPKAPAAPAVPAHAFSDPARTELELALGAYEQMRASLAADSIDVLAAQGENAAGSLRAVATTDVAMPPAVAAPLASSAASAEAVARAPDLEAARSAFAKLSKHMIAALSADPRVTEGIQAYECTMTTGFNKWLQRGGALANPYQGSNMLTCGTAIDVGSITKEAPPEAHEHGAGDIAHYTCPMDTWVKRKHPGSCPVCGMDLVPVTQEEIRTGVMRIDHRRRQLIGLKTGLVERRELSLQVNAVGRVAYDETRLADVTLKYHGWIHKLYVEETGKRVKRGQTLLTIYSPELYSAQQEYLLALSQREAAVGDSSRARADVLVRGARQRLKLWDVSNAQLKKIAASGEPMQYLPIASPASGYVVAKDVVEGAAVKQGQRLFRIASLDRVWVEADVYEKDIPLVKVGQSAVVTLSHLPGRSFEGKVSFIYPYLDGAARTSRARIELANTDLVLKPDMYANVELEVPKGERLVVPESAVIYSGPRRVVFLDMDRERLRPLPIEVGVKAEGFFEVISGLEEGDRVVTSGNFLLSAESRLKAATGLW